MTLLTILLAGCALIALVAAVLVLSAVIVAGRARRFEEDHAWWMDEAGDKTGQVAEEECVDEIA